MNFSRHPLAKDALLTVLLGALAFAALGATGWLAFVAPGVPSDEDIAAEVEALRSRDILEYKMLGEGSDAVVSYSYVGEPLPERLAEDEAVERRTENSWSRVVGQETDGDPIITTVFFPEDQFVSRSDGWHQVNYAQTTKERFDEARKERPLEALLWRRAHAASLTAFSGSGDGHVANGHTTECDTGWATAHDDTDGTTFDYTSQVIFAGLTSFTFKSSECTIYRTFIPFNTSSIPSGATVSAATLTIYATSTIADSDNDGNDFITVVQTSQATHTVLAFADFDQCGAISNPTEGIDTGQRKDITSMTVGNSYTFTLNATGRGWIKKAGQTSSCSATTGITCLGIREGHDVLNSAIGNSSTNQLPYSASEADGTSQDPYLSITYSVPNAFWQFQDY